MKISMPRGDIKWIHFRINKPDGTGTNLEFSNIYFTVKRKAFDRMFLFQKSYKRGEIYKLGPSDYQLKIDAQDTNKLTFGNYKFDIQLSYRDLLKETCVGDFVILEEVTHAINEDEADSEIDPEQQAVEEEPNVIMTIPNYHLIELETPVAVGGTGDYADLEGKPTINGVELIGDLSLEELGISGSGTGPGMVPISAEELDEICYR